MAFVTSTQVITARKAAGLGQAAAAALIGASVRSWQEWEQGRRNMPGAKLELFKLKAGVL